MYGDELNQGQSGDWHSGSVTPSTIARFFVNSVAGWRFDVQDFISVLERFGIYPKITEISMEDTSTMLFKFGRGRARSSGEWQKCSRPLWSLIAFTAYYRVTVILFW